MCFSLRVCRVYSAESITVGRKAIHPAVASEDGVTTQPLSASQVRGEALGPQGVQGEGLRV